MIESAYGEWVSRVRSGDLSGLDWRLIRGGQAIASVYHDGSALLHLGDAGRSQLFEVDITARSGSVEEGMRKVEHRLSEIAALRLGDKTDPT